MYSINIKSKGLFWKGSIFMLLSIFLSSCDFEYALPEANSIPDETLPSAAFSYRSSDADFTTVEFTNLSGSATDFAWDFGGGNTSNEKDPTHTFTDGEGTYPVTLTVSDRNGASDVVTIDVVVEDVFVPITPTILNGDFTEGQDDWKFSSFSGGTTSPFNSSSDGSNLNYDGSDNGAKTPGAKWTMSTSAGAYLSADTRYAYQAIVVSPNTEYILEYEYAIKNDGTQAPGDNRIIGGIISGHFDDGAEAIPTFDTAPLVSHIGSEDLGKGNFTLVKEQFTSNSSGEIAILIYGVTDVDAYVDNVKVYPL